MAKLKFSIAPNGLLIENPNGALEAPIDSSLPHRFEIVDGVIVDKYNGASDAEIKALDHAEAVALAEAAIAEWDAAEVKVGARPVLPPALDI